MPTDYAGAQGLDGRWSGGESEAAIVGFLHQALPSDGGVPPRGRASERNKQEMLLGESSWKPGHLSGWRSKRKK